MNNTKQYKTGDGHKQKGEYRKLNTASPTERLPCSVCTSRAKEPAAQNDLRSKTENQTWEERQGLP